jgi:fatty-acyl-CoA synthase
MNNVKKLDIENTKPQALLSSVGKAPTEAAVLNYISESAAFDGRKPFLTRSLGPSDPEEPQVIMYTSGTTGRPKGAVLSHRKTFFNCLNADIFFKMHFDDSMLVILPLFHSGGLFIQASPVIYKGATMVVHSKFDPVKVYQDIERYKITKFLGVPTVYRALVKVDPQERGDISSLKVCAGGGEKTTPELFEKCREAGLAFRQVMGQTETSILLWASEEDSFRKPGTVGRPVFHAEVNIVDKNGRPVKPGDIGEIVVRGSIMMKEYWQDPVRTEETIRNGVLYTGDLARTDEEGYYFLVDRAREMYITGGENVYPAEVEHILIPVILPVPMKKVIIFWLTAPGICTLPAEKTFIRPRLSAS